MTEVGRSDGERGRASGPRAQVQAALAALRGRRLAGRRARYRVPLYLVIGPPGMGKTTMIERAGLDLDPPVEAGPTAWWVGEDAVFVEATVGAAGGEADDVLALLKAVRPAQAINGVLLVVSPADLTLADGVERRDMGAMVARFLREAEVRLGCRPPVYVMLSKLDLTPGFSDFFERLEVQDREQPWGFALPLEGASGADPTIPDMTAAYQTGFRGLLEAIRGRLIAWLSREPDAVRCGRMVSFGAQIAALESTLRPVLEPLLPSGARKRRGVFLRGVYLTSGRQDALAIDALLPELAQRFALPRIGALPPDLNLDEEEFGYFINGTLRNAVLPEAGLVARAPGAWWRRPLVGWTLAAAVVAVCLQLGVWALPRYEAGLTKVALVDEAVETLGEPFAVTDPEALPTLLVGLDRIRTLQAGLAPPLPRAVGLGLSQPDALSGRVAAAYTQALRNSLLPHLAARLSADLVDMQADPETLRSRLSAAGQNAGDRSEALRRWLENQAARLPEPAVRTALLEHGGAALRAGGSLDVDAAYLDAARRIVAFKESLK